MNVKQLSVLLVFGIIVSTGYGASPEGAVMLDDLNGENNLVYGSAHNNLPGGNAILGAPGSAVNPAAVVPEPSAAALLCLGVVGLGVLKLRRRRPLNK